MASEEIIITPRLSSVEVSRIGNDLKLDLMDMFAWHQNELMMTLEKSVKNNSLEDTQKFLNSI